jgi:hypothetical protein
MEIVPISYMQISNRRFLLIGERSQHRTLGMEMTKPDSVLVEFDMKSVEFLSKEVADTLVEPIGIEQIAPVEGFGKGLFETNRIRTFKPYWRVRLEEEETLVSGKITIQDVSKFLSKPSWGKLEYFNASKLQYVLMFFCNLTLEIFPQIYERYRKKKHKYLIASQKRKR